MFRFDFTFLLLIFGFTCLKSKAQEYVVALKPGFYANSFRAKMNTDQLRVVRVTQLLSSNIFLIEKNRAESEKVFINRLKQNHDVLKIEPNILFHVFQVPNDQLYSKLWGLKNTGQPDDNMERGIPGIDIGIEKAWSITKGAKDIRVAVIDTGINWAHPDLRENIFLNEAEVNGLPGIDDDQNGFIDDVHGWNFISNSNSPLDDMGHGTHVAGTIGARGNNGVGVTGVCWSVSLIPIKALNEVGAGTLSQAIEAIQYAVEMKANIINASWGSSERSEILENLLKEVSNKGILFVAAAGNDHRNTDERPVFPASYDTLSVLPVAAINSKGELGSFSNWGWKTVPIAAPGVGILSTRGNSYTTYSGTSMAAPFVSGLAALILSLNPRTSLRELKNRIISTATPLYTKKNFVRAGLINAENAIFNIYPQRDTNDAFFWQDKIENFVSTPHPYLASTTYAYEISIPGAKRVSLFLKKLRTEKDYDKLIIFDRNGKVLHELSGTVDNTWSPPLESDYLKLEFKTNSFRQNYGFDITELAYQK